MKMIKPFYIVASANDNTPLVVEITAKAKTAFITIKGHISNWRNSSSDIEAQIKTVTNKGATKAELYINSGGGDVFEANEMLNLIDDNFSKVNVKLGALCASAGTIFLARYYTTAKKNTKIMIHKPSVYASGNEDQIAGKLKLLKDVTADYKKMYADKMGITLKAVEDLWAKGDYWLTAKEALKKGLIDAIEDAEAPIDAQTRMQLVACGAPNIPEQKQNPNNNIMEKLKLIALLGLNPDATDAQIEAAIKANKEGAATASTLQAKLDNESKAAKTQKIKALLDDAEKAKKITPAQRTSFEALAEADFDNAKTVIENMQEITAVSGNLDAKTTANRTDWDYKKYQEENPEAFKALAKEKQEELIEAFYKEE